MPRSRTFAIPLWLAKMFALVPGLLMFALVASATTGHSLYKLNPNEILLVVGAGVASILLGAMVIPIRNRTTAIVLYVAGIAGIVVATGHAWIELEPPSVIHQHFELLRWFKQLGSPLQVVMGILAGLTCVAPIAALDAFRHRPRYDATGHYLIAMGFAELLLTWLLTQVAPTGEMLSIHDLMAQKESLFAQFGLLEVSVGVLLALLSFAGLLCALILPLVQCVWLKRVFAGTDPGWKVRPIESDDLTAQAVVVGAEDCDGVLMQLTPSQGTARMFRGTVVSQPVERLYLEVGKNLRALHRRAMFAAVLLAFQITVLGMEIYRHLG